MMTIPNFISVSRLLLVPFIIWFIVNQLYVFAFWLFFAASISDAVDGYLARKFSIKSKLGSILDPLADKVLLVTVMVTLGVLGTIPMWLVTLVVARDLFMLMAYVFTGKRLKDQNITPSLISKFNTTFQMSYVTLVLTDLAFTMKLPDMFYTALIYLVAFTTTVSWMGYMRKWINLLLRKK